MSAKDTSPWWRKGYQVGLQLCFYNAEYVEWYFSTSLANKDLANHDCIMEALWAEKNGLS